MRMKREHRILLAVNLLLVAGFGAVFVARLNYEFIIYVGVILGCLGLVGLSIRRVDYTLGSLVGLTVWSALHLAGGGVVVGEGRLYDVMLVRLSDAYPVWRYDQLVHIWGFGASTLVMYSLLRGPLDRPARHPVALSVVLVMAGLGVGALNEVLEFAVSALVPESGVGGYVNTSLDLCADLLGALLGLVYIRVRYLGREPRSAAGAGARPPIP
jgi:putative membrane protein